MNNVKKNCTFLRGGLPLWLNHIAIYIGKYAAVFSSMSSESSLGSVSSLYGGANSISDGIFRQGEVISVKRVRVTQGGVGI